MKTKDKIINEQLSDIELRILYALENPTYKWRTLKGISAEISIDLLRVELALKYLKEKESVIFASKPTKDGDILYTSMNRYMSSKEFRINRWLSVLSDEIK